MTARGLSSRLLKLEATVTPAERAWQTLRRVARRVQIAEPGPLPPVEMPSPVERAEWVDEVMGRVLSAECRRRGLAVPEPMPTGRDLFAALRTFDPPVRGGGA